jgi:hypothetical protein
MNKTLIIFSIVLFLLAIVIIIWASYFRDKEVNVDLIEDLVVGEV